MWVDVTRSQYAKQLAIKPSDSNWVGAWWIGYLASGVLLFVMSIPLFFIPRYLLKNSFFLNFLLFKYNYKVDILNFSMYLIKLCENKNEGVELLPSIAVIDFVLLF